MDNFSLGEPALVCRWRLAGCRLPLENRHLRALAARKVGGGPVPAPLLAWVKQHLEWTLQDGASKYPDGVLMLVVDTEGKAAATVGPYTPLIATSANDFIQRALAARKEALVTGVAPEELWLVRGNTLVRGTKPELSASGAASLIVDLARTLGMPVIHDDNLLKTVVTAGIKPSDEVFLVSDEHGVVPARDRGGERAKKFAGSYERLLEKVRG